MDRRREMDETYDEIECKNLFFEINFELVLLVKSTN